MANAIFSNISFLYNVYYTYKIILEIYNNIPLFDKCLMLNKHPTLPYPKKKNLLCDFFVSLLIDFKTAPP